MDTIYTNQRKNVLSMMIARLVILQGYVRYLSVISLADLPAHSFSAYY